MAATRSWERKRRLAIWWRQRGGEAGTSVRWSEAQQTDPARMRGLLVITVSYPCIVVALICMDV